MRKKLILLIFFILVCTCMEGPMGPKGSSPKFYKQTGILYVFDTTATGCWEKHVDCIYDSSIVQVSVRLNAGYLWTEPLWFFSKENKIVRMYKDYRCGIGYEYQIIVINPQ